MRRASQFAQLGRLTEHAIHVWENVCFTRERLAPPCKIFINRGKGAKDRYILFPTSFRLVLKRESGPFRVLRGQAKGIGSGS